ncbi:unnamed protein product [Penicillium palitans]
MPSDCKVYKLVVCGHSLENEHNLQFYPDEKESTLNRTVLLLYAVGGHQLAQGGNHWSFYLYVGRDQSVRIDITPSYPVPSVTAPGGSKAYLLVGLLPYVYSHSASKVVEIQVRTGVKVKEFVDLLIQHNRHQYEFNAQGEGCRYWTDDQLTLFQRAGLVRLEKRSSRSIPAKSDILS